jgi:threonine/homoserine/homoserine lactone efflux protein
MGPIMTPEHALAFVVFAMVAAGTPGPSNLLLTATGAQVGIMRGIPALIGVSLGMGVMMLTVAYGLGSIVLAHPTLVRALNWLGGAFLLWLAWKIATARGGDGAAARKPVGFVGAAAFQWINPKSWLVCAGAAAPFLDPQGGSSVGQSAAFGLLFLLVSLPSCFPWLAFGAILQRRLRSERAARVFNGVMGALLAASVILVLW